MAKNIIFLFWIILNFILFCTTATEDITQTPCPEFFQYKKEHNRWIGAVEIPSPPLGTTIKLLVNLSLRSQLSGVRTQLREREIYYGSLELAGTREDAIENMINGLNVRYKIYFPILWPLPKVRSIIFNNQIICVGELDKSAKVITVIKLEHTLYTEAVALELMAKNEIITNDRTSRLLQITESLLKTTEAKENPKKHTNDDSCGEPLPLNRLILGGSIVRKGEFPWLAAIFITRENSLKFICGGTLISGKTVATAAHCMIHDGGEMLKPENIVVMLGKHNLKNWTENTETMSVEKIIPHPDFQHDGDTFDADLALIVFKKAATFGRFIKTACLWRDSVSDITSFDGKTGTVVGWGRNEKEKISKYPRKLEISIVSDATCLRSHPAFQIMTSNRTFCAGNNSKVKPETPCNGDSGGGFLMFTKSKWYLKGIISTSLVDPETQSCDWKKYVVFTDLSKFNTWLTQNVE